MHASLLSVFVCLSLLNLHQKVNGHSWIECTKYLKTVDGQNFDSSMCEGWIRGWSEFNSNSFSADMGINYQPSPGGAMCQKTISPSNDYAGSYTDDYPMATYTIGDQIRILWPAKNHANYECFNNIPDEQLKLFVNPEVEPTSDPSVSDFSDVAGSSTWELVHDYQDGCTAGTDGCGFQNCPKFCEDTGAAECYGDFILEQSHFSSEGIYTFMWFWEFNPGLYYTSCFEANVVFDGTPVVLDVTTTRSPALPPITPTTPSPVSMSAISGSCVNCQEWYMAISLDNIDASVCGDSVSSIALSSVSGWQTSTGMYSGNVYQFNEQNSLPLSLRFTMSSGNEIIVEDAFTSYGGSFTSSMTICGEDQSAASASAETPEPTPRPITPAPVAVPTEAPTDDPVVCVSQDSVLYLEILGALAICTVSILLVNMVMAMCVRWKDSKSATYYRQKDLNY